MISKKTCLVLNKEDLFTVIEENGKGSYISRLTYLDELKPEFIKTAKEISKNLFLLNIQEDFGPWELLDPFPPIDYYDYGYINLEDKSKNFTVTRLGINNMGNDIAEFNYWDILNNKDKEIVVNNFKKNNA